jgi:hypothetical protein
MQLATLLSTMLEHETNRLKLTRILRQSTLSAIGGNVVFIFGFLLSVLFHGFGLPMRGKGRSNVEFRNMDEVLISVWVMSSIKSCDCPRRKTTRILTKIITY